MPHGSPQNDFEREYERFGGWAMRDLGYGGPTPVHDDWDAASEATARMIASELDLILWNHPLGPAGVYLAFEEPGAAAAYEGALPALLDFLGKRLADYIAASTA